MCVYNISRDGKRYAYSNLRKFSELKDIFFFFASNQMGEVNVVTSVVWATHES